VAAFVDRNNTILIESDRARDSRDELEVVQINIYDDGGGWTENKTLILSHVCFFKIYRNYFTWMLSVKKRYFIISDLINFEIKIIPEKSRIDFEA